MSKLREQARGRPCMIRLPGVCDGGGETTVLAHYNLPGLSGMGMKPHDLIGAHSCFGCHEIVDGRQMLHDLVKAERQLAHANGVIRTIHKLLQEGKIRIV